MYAYYYGSEIKDLNRFELLADELPLTQASIMEQAHVPKYNMVLLFFTKPSL